MNVSRRRWIEGSVATGIALALRPPLAGAAKPDSLVPITMRIPSTGERLPVVAIGTNQYSVSAPEELAARREVLELLPQLGASVVDTAWGYGESEQVIGSLVRELSNRERLFIATKTPNRGPIPPGSGAVDQASGDAGPLGARFSSRATHAASFGLPFVQHLPQNRYALPGGRP